MSPKRFLQLLQLGKQAQGVQCLRHPQQQELLTRGQRTIDKESLHGCLSLIGGTPHFPPVSLFRCQLHRGLKAIDIHPPRPIEFSELTRLRMRRQSDHSLRPAARSAHFSAQHNIGRYCAGAVL